MPAASNEVLREPIHVLVVDDDPDIALMLEDRLDAMGTIVLIARNGEDAIRHLDTSPVDAVLLDIEMPRMSGIETLRMIRTRFPTLPVFMMTEVSNTDRLNEALQEGATGYLPKPINFNEMEQVLRNLFPSRLAGPER